MSVDLVQDCVVLPHPPNWDQAVNWSRKWATSIAAGVTGPQDRAAGRTKPLQKISFTPLAQTLNRTLLAQRLLEALRRGKACSPFWTRPSPLLADASGTSATVDSLWPWAVGDYAFFVRKRSRLQNTLLQIDAGGAAVSPFLVDQFFSGGSEFSTATAVNTSGVSDPAPAAVYQSCRQGVYGPASTTFTYTFSGLDPSVTCLVRLHFASIDPNDLNHHPDLKLTVSGDGSQTALHQPIEAAGGQFIATVKEFRIAPSWNGSLTVTVASNQNYGADFGPTLLNALEICQYSWETRTLIAPSGVGQLTWSGALKGTYPAGEEVFPVIFGTPAAEDMSAITSRLGSTQITIEEPIGDGQLATPGSCPAEVCDPWDIPFPQRDGQPPFWGSGAPSDPTSITWFASSYVLPIALDTDPMLYLLPFFPPDGGLACYINLLNTEWDQQVAAGQLQFNARGPLFWYHFDGSGETEIAATAKIGSGSCVADVANDQLDNTMTVYTAPYTTLAYYFW